MKTIPISKVLVDLDGNSLKKPEDGSDLTLGRALAVMLITHEGKRFDDFKLWDLSKRFNSKEDSILIDDPDFESLKLVVSDNKGYSALVRGQIVEQFMMVTSHLAVVPETQKQ